MVFLSWKAIFVALEGCQHPRTTWISCIANQSIRRELASLVVLADSGPSPHVGIVHRTRPAYVEIPKQTFGWHHALQNDWMKSFAVVVIWSMQSGCNDGYVRAIHCPHHIGNLVQVLELMCISFHSGRRGPVDEFTEQIFFMAPQNWKTASWLEDMPILYKLAMHCMELSVANLEIDTTTFTWIGIAKRNLVSRLCKCGARILHKYSKVESSIRMRPLNSLALNEPNRFWSKNPGLCNPRSWAHKHRCCLPLHNFKPCHASVKPIYWPCHNKIASLSLDIHSRVANRESWKISKIVSLWTSGSIVSTTLVWNLSGSWEKSERDY